MNTLFVFCCIVAVFYFSLIITILVGWYQIKPYQLSKTNHKKLKISIILAVKNEEKNIRDILDSIVQQSYPQEQYELIIVDDHSEDNSCEIIKDYCKEYRNFKLYHLSWQEYGKKRALLKGIQCANGELIITTDADCIVPVDWLAIINDFYIQHTPDLILGSVVIQDSKSVFSRLQTLELLGLIGAGAGTAGIKHPILCNAANMAFKKNVFNELQDPLNIKYISGDDIFLLLNMKKNKKKIMFLKSLKSTVYTKAAPTLKTFFAQRLRWTSKSRGYRNIDIIVSASIVLLYNIILTILLFACLFDFTYITLFIALFTTKLFINLLFLIPITSFYKKTYLLKYLFLSEIFYFIYASTLGLSSWFVKAKNI